MSDRPVTRPAGQGVPAEPCIHCTHDYCACAAAKQDASELAQTMTPPVTRPAPPPEAHEHSWQPCGTTEHETILYSPVSALDHVVVTQTLAIRSCECGAIRRTEVGRKERWLNR